MSTVIDLGKAAKKQFPGQFDDLEDAELGRQLKLNNPGEYDDITEVSKAEPRSGPSKFFHGLEYATTRLSSPTARKVLAPLARKLPISGEAKSKIKALEGSKEFLYGSDIAEAVAPGIFEPQPGMPLLTAGRILSRMGIDIATDPASLINFGAPTKLGRVLRILEEAKQASKITKEPIKLTSKIAKDVTELYAGSKQFRTKELTRLLNTYPDIEPSVLERAITKPSSSAEALRQIRRTPAKTFSQQVAKGERSLASIGPIPLGSPETPLPFMTGKVAGRLVQPLSALRRGMIGAKIENLGREVFSSHSGNPDFDLLISKFRSLVEYRKGVVIADAKVMEKQAQDLTRELGISREELNKHIRTAGEIVTPTTKAMSKQKYSKAIYDEILNHYQEGLVTAKVALKNATKAGDAKAIDEAAKQLVDYNSEINRMTGKYKPPPSISPEIDKMVNEINERNAQQLLRDQTSGVSVRPLLSDRNYIPHILTTDARKAMADKLKREGKLPAKLSVKEFDEHLSNAIRRQFVEVKPVVIGGWKEAGLITGRQAKAILSKDKASGLDKMDELLKSGKITEEQYTDAVHTLSIDEVNALPAETKLKIFGTDAPEIFHTDPIYYTTIRGIRGEVARTSAEFFAEMKARGLALTDTNAPKHWVNVRSSELSGFKVAPEIARVLNKWDTFNTNPEELSKVFRAYDKFHKLMKVWTLAPFPAYHTLNMVGNFWNNFLAGITNPDVYRQALMTQISQVDKRYRPVRFKDVYGKEWNTETLTEEARKLGVIGKGQYGAEVQQTLKQELEKGKFLTLSSRSHFLRVGNRLGKFIEDNARMAHFIDRLRKGDTAEQAALSVKKFLFDYSDLSQIEKQVFNRVFFFYTWTRKNIPLQLHSLVTQPAKFSLPFKAKHEIEKEIPGADEQYLQEYVKENFPIRIRYDAKTQRHEYFMLNRWLPAADLVKLSHLHEIALQMLAPLPKEVIQQVISPKGYDFYFKDVIEHYKGEKKKFIGIRAPSRIVHVAKAIRLLNEIDKLTKEDADLFTKMVGLATGKNYTYDASQAMMFNKSRVDDDVKELMKGLYREQGAKKPDEKEIERIKALIQAKYQEY